MYGWMLRRRSLCLFKRQALEYALHAMLMIFFFVMPATVSGFGNLLLPVTNGIPEMVFPKINNLGLCFWFLSEFSH
jgi:heme/copper-type cytochrome/quinol oxidase subunit 1